MEVPQKRWMVCFMENPIFKIDDLGVALFRETPRIIFNNCTAPRSSQNLELPSADLDGSKPGSVAPGLEWCHRQ